MIFPQRGCGSDLLMLSEGTLLDEANGASDGIECMVVVNHLVCFPLATGLVGLMPAMKHVAEVERKVRIVVTMGAQF